MASPDFSRKTVDLIAYRAAYICSNPNCNRLTIAPSAQASDATIKIGEGAHIHDARKETIRFDSNLSDGERAEPANGIWLCASCHTEVDKNKGRDYPAETLKTWKREHEELVLNLLQKHQSPLPILRRMVNDSKLAQAVVDLVSAKGVFYQDHYYEVLPHVVDSLVDVRKELLKIGREIDYEERLKKINKDIQKSIQDCMNYTSKYPEYSPSQMDVMRQKIGVSLKALRDEYGCKVTGDITKILPS